jgi:hypothetical protein
MACNVPRQVGATYKTLWTKVKQNTAARLAGITKKRYKGLGQAPKYVSPTLTYNYHRDYGLKPDNQVSILTLEGRVVVSYTGYQQLQENRPRARIPGRRCQVFAAGLDCVRPVWVCLLRQAD